MNTRLISILLLGGSIGTQALADEPGRHPSYLHALSDLRAAQWQIDHRRPEDPHISRAETDIHEHIAAAITEVQRAAKQDDKPAQDRVPVDTGTHEGRLHAAVDLLRKARDDIARPEDDPRARRFQENGLAQVDAAIFAAERAIGDVQREGAPRR